MNKLSYEQKGFDSVVIRVGSPKKVAKVYRRSNICFCMLLQFCHTSKPSISQLCSPYFSLLNINKTWNPVNNLEAVQKFHLSLTPNLGSQVQFFMNGIKKGIRCKTWAVPAAVSPGCKLQPFLLNYKVTAPTKSRDGKTSVKGMSQKTCH